MLYCSPEHQREHWVTHKAECARQKTTTLRGPQGERKLEQDQEIANMVREVERLKGDASFARMIEAKKRDNVPAAFTFLQSAIQCYDVQELARRANIALRPMMGVMPVLAGLLRVGLTDDSVLRHFFGDPNHVRGMLLEVEMMSSAPAASPACMMMQSFAGNGGASFGAASVHEEYTASPTFVQGREAYDCDGNARTTDVESEDELVRLAESSGLRENRKPDEFRVTNFLFLPKGVPKELEDCRRLEFLAEDGRRVDCYYTRCFFESEDGPYCGISLDAVVYGLAGQMLGATFVSPSFLSGI